MIDTLLDTRYATETPEGITLGLSPAGVVARCYAFAIDFSIRLVVVIAAGSLLGQLGGLGAGLTLVLFFLLEWLYPVAFELTAAAATPGKRAMGLRVVMDTGLPVTPAASLTRNLLRAADFMPFLWAFGLVSMLLRPDFKRLGDLAAGTLVVHVLRPPRADALPAAPPRAPASRLSTRAQAAIVAWAARVDRLTEARAEELAALAPASVVAHASGERRISALVGVAHWILGRR